jgi:hypothetical protein
LQVIYGCFRPRLIDDWDWAAAAVYLPPMPSDRLGSSPTTASLCLRRDYWQALTGMPEDLRAGEDLLFFRDLESRMPATATAESALVEWDLPSGPWAQYRRLRRYSAATWPTRLASRWHRPVLRMYAAALALIVAASLGHPALLVALPGLALLRIGRNYARRASGLPGTLTLGRAWRIGVATVLADAAMFAGIRDAFLGRS